MVYVVNRGLSLVILSEGACLFCVLVGFDRSPLIEVACSLKYQFKGKISQDIANVD